MGACSTLYEMYNYTKFLKKIAETKGGIGMSRSIGYTEICDLNTQWREVLHLGVRRKYSKGAQIMHEERALFFLEKGRVRLTHHTQDGQEKILWYIGPGCIFGETPFFDPMPGSGESVHECAATSDIYVFSCDCVYGEIVKIRPDLILNLLPSLARKVRLLSNQASSLSVDDVLIRLCKFLGQRVVPGSSPLRVRPGISRQELASVLGVHRITLYKVLKQQEESGLFGPGLHDQQSFTVLDPERFFELANS